MSHSDMSGMDDMPSTGSGSMGGMKMYFHGSIGSDRVFFLLSCMVWFESWMPSSAGAVVGVCIGLLLFAIFERYLVAFRRACDQAWSKGQIGFVRPRTSGPYTFLGRHPSSSSVSLSGRGPAAARTPDEKNMDLAPSYSTGPSLEMGSGTGGSDRSSADRLAHIPLAVRRNLEGGREARWSRPWRAGTDVPRGLIQALQTFIHYLLMLVVMTFNIWYILAVVVGAGVGEMLFGRFGPPGVSGEHH